MESAIEVSDVANAVVDICNLGVRVGTTRGCAVGAEGSSVDGTVVDILARLFVVLHRSTEGLRKREFSHPRLVANKVKVRWVTGTSCGERRAHAS